MTKIIGLTGGIGSGKSTIAEFISSLGIPVYIADEEAKKISNSPIVIQQISKIFGSEIIKNNIIDREKLSSLVFRDKEKLVLLNSIIHPLVAKDFSNWLNVHKDKKLVCKESAILFETGNDKSCDFVITISAPIEDRIKRVMLRDNISREQILERMKNQWTEEEKALKSDFVVSNTSIEITKNKIKEIINQLKF